MFVFRDKDNSWLQSGSRREGVGVCTSYNEQGEEADRHTSARFWTAKLAG